MVTASFPPHPHCAQGQVTRAQEAEENYVIKRELAVVRQQCSSTAEDLQKAQSTIRQLQEQQVPGGWMGLTGRTTPPTSLGATLTCWPSGLRSVMWVRVPRG